MLLAERPNTRHKQPLFSGIIPIPIPITNAKEPITTRFWPDAASIGALKTYLNPLRLPMFNRDPRPGIRDCWGVGVGCSLLCFHRKHNYNYLRHLGGCGCGGGSIYSLQAPSQHSPHPSLLPPPPPPPLVNHYTSRVRVLPTSDQIRSAPISSAQLRSHLLYSPTHSLLADQMATQPQEATNGNGEYKITRPPPTPSPLRFSKFFQVPLRVALSLLCLISLCFMLLPSFHHRLTCAFSSPVEPASLDLTSSTNWWRMRKTRFLSCLLLNS